MTEADYQRKILRRLERYGFYVLKLISTNKSGIPDLLALKPDRAIFIEVKGDKGKPSKLQLYRIQELEDLGFECYLTYPGDDLLTVKFPRL